MRKIIIHKCQFYDDSFGTTAHSIKFCDNFEDAKAKILSDVKEYYEGDEEVNNCKTLDELSQLLILPNNSVSISPEKLANKGSSILV